MTLTVGGLFSGIGGWELGLERAGMEIAWHCDSDPFCRRVLEKHWPGVPVFDDVQTLTAGMAEGVDVLCGGFPCQDISLAGKGAGIEGSRSGLWAEFARLICEFEPRWVLVENVAALRSRGLDRVLRDLAALGYDAEWDCLPASAFGAPHRRDRIWIVAYPDRAGSQGWFVPRGDGATVARAGNDRSHEADSPRDDFGRERAGQARYGWVGPADGGSGVGGIATDPNGKQHEGASHALGRTASTELWCQWAVEPDVGRVAHGVPSRVDRLHALGNALVPQIAEWIGRRIMEWEAANA